MQNKAINYCKSKFGLLGLIFIMLYFADFISKVGYYETNSKIVENLSSFLKIFLQCVSIYMIIKYKSHIGYKILKGMVLLTLIFLAGHIYLESPVPLHERLLSNFRVFNHYIFIFIITGGYYAYKEDKSDKIKNLLSAFEIVFIINSVFVITGMIFEIQILKSYFFGNRFGYSGLFRNSTHASYISMIYVVYFCYKAIETPNLRAKLLFVISFIIALIIATKAVCLFSIVLIISLLYKYKRYKILICFCIFILIAILNSNIIIEILIKTNFRVLYDVYREKGIITMLFSYRNQSLGYASEYILANWSPINYIIGGAEFNLWRTEFELIDFYLFFGIVGTAVFFIYWNNYIFAFSKLFKFRLYAIIFFISLLAGSFFSGAPTMTYLFVANLYFLNKFAKRYQDKAALKTLQQTNMQ